MNASSFHLCPTILKMYPSLQMSPGGHLDSRKRRNYSAVRHVDGQVAHMPCARTSMGGLAVPADSRMSSGEKMHGAARTIQCTIHNDKGHDSRDPITSRPSPRFRPRFRVSYSKLGQAQSAQLNTPYSGCAPPPRSPLPMLSNGQQARGEKSVTLPRRPRRPIIGVS